MDNTKKREDEIRGLLHQILDIVIDGNGIDSRSRDKTSTMPTLFMRFTGHVSEISVDLHEDGWVSGGHYTTYETYLRNLSPEFVERLRTAVNAALLEKKQSEVLARDIKAKEQAIADSKEVLSNMKKELRKTLRREAANG